MTYLTYKDVQRLSECCRALRELSSIEFMRRKTGTTSNYLVFRSKNLKSSSESFLHHPKCDARAFVHMGVERTEQKLTEVIDQLRFRPRTALIFTGNVNSQEHQKWSKWFKHRLPSDCTIMNVQSKTAVCGSIDEHVYEVHQEKKDFTCGLAYLFVGAQSPSCSIQMFKSLKELVSLTDKPATQNEPVKGILYFSRTHSRKQLSKILSVSKENNKNLSIAFGGLVVDSLVTNESTSKIECSGLVFSGSNVKAASTIIEDMTNDSIRDAMIRFRDSIPFDIADATKNTICFLLSCIEHSPNINHSSEYTESESDIFHTIFPCNVKAFGLSGHGEFGQVSGVMEEQKKISYQFSCIMVLVQFPIK